MMVISDTIFVPPLLRSIYLVGMMGSGKTYWNSQLAAYFGRPAMDLDALIEAAQGQSIANIFAEKGEAAFRIIEAATLRKHVETEPFIMATGGGTPCFEGNMDFMLHTGLVLWLNPPVHELITRLQANTISRPLLAETGGVTSAIADKIATLMAVREPWYRLAHVQVNDPHPTLQLILNALANDT